MTEDRVDDLPGFPGQLLQRFRNQVLMLDRHQRQVNTHLIGQHRSPDVRAQQDMVGLHHTLIGNDRRHSPIHYFKTGYQRISLVFGGAFFPGESCHGLNCVDGFGITIAGYIVAAMNNLGVDQGDMLLHLPRCDQG